MPSADQLATVPLFSALSDTELQELASWFEERDVSEGVRLVGEGVSGYTFYVLTKGSAVVTAGLGVSLGTRASLDLAYQKGAFPDIRPEFGAADAFVFSLAFSF